MMPNTNAKNRMMNWSRDFIQVHTFRNGFCEENEYKTYFPRFKQSYGYDGSAEDLLKELARGGFISRKNGKLTWLLPIAEKNKQ